MELLSVGNTAKVFLINNRQIVKIFHKKYQALTRVEYDNYLIAKRHGLPVSQRVVISRVGEKNGLVLDYIKGTTMDKLRSSERLKTFVSLQKIFNSKIDRSLQSYKERLLEYAGTNIRLKNRIKNLPNEDYICHGDFHFGNIICFHNCYSVVDLVTMCKGPKEYDIANTVYLLYYKCGRLFSLGLLKKYLKLCELSFFDIYPYIKIIYQCDKLNIKRKKIENKQTK